MLDFHAVAMRPLECLVEEYVLISSLIYTESALKPMYMSLFNNIGYIRQNKSNPKTLHFNKRKNS